MGKRGRRRDVTRRDVLDVMTSNTDDPRRPWTVGDISDALDCSGQTVRDRLGELVSLDLVDTRKVGARARVWWVPADADDEARAYADDD